MGENKEEDIVHLDVDVVIDIIEALYVQTRKKKNVTTLRAWMKTKKH